MHWRATVARGKQERTKRTRLFFVRFFLKLNTRAAAGRRPRGTGPLIFRLPAARFRTDLHRDLQVDQSISQHPFRTGAFFERMELFFVLLFLSPGVFLSRLSSHLSRVVLAKTKVDLTFYAVIRVIDREIYLTKFVTGEYFHKHPSFWGVFISTIKNMFHPSTQGKDNT